jgi:tetratricopeptide (TPR) repeat protein
MRPTLRLAAIWIASVLLLSVPMLALRADSQELDDIRNNPLVKEVSSTPETEMRGWQSIYSAYSCVFHHSYALASRWLMNALKEGAGDQILKSRYDISYLSGGLSSIAAKRHEAAAPESSCDAQVLQGLMQSIVGSEAESVDTLKRAAINNPTYPSLQYLKTKIRAMEFNMSCNPWLTPPDVAQMGGKSNHFSKWRMDRFPLKVYVPTDVLASKMPGYKAGDGLLLRSAFETWQRQSGGKLRFVYEPVQTRADITCGWVSDQKVLPIADAVGVTWRWADGNDYLYRAEIKVLTFTTWHYAPSNFDNQFRKNCLEEVCLHEIGHSLGLNHSTSENDVMCPHMHWQPITTPTTRDVAALSSLYLTNYYENISAAVDAIQCGQYKAALAPLDKVILANPKDGQTRDALCTCLSNAATAAMHDADYATAIKLLTKANELASGSESTRVREQVLKNLHYAFLQSGRSKEAEKLEKQNASLLTSTSQDSASFLDQYGMKRESMPHYEEALAKSPDDLAIRGKFCFLLVMLARDELNKNNDDDAISLLTRAKSLLRRGMPPDIIDKVISALSNVYEGEGRYDAADQVWKGKAALLPPPAEETKPTSEDDIARLKSAAKKKHPEEWLGTKAEKSQCAKIELAYQQYAEALRQCATTMNAKDEPTWALVFIVRNKLYDRHGAQDPLGTMFDLRHRLIDLTDEGAVVDLEARLPYKKVALKPTSSPAGAAP